MHTPAQAPRRWIVLAILSGSLLLISMDTTILNVAFPSLVDDLQPGAVQQLWIIDVYALALSGLLVTAGALGDRWGRKRLLVVGFGIFSLASLIAVLSTEAWHVIAARALLGIGGAAIMPATVSILRTVFTDAKERAFALAVWAAVFGGGMAFGPVVGGLLVQDYGWHSAFLLNLPVAAVIVAAGLRYLPESRSPRSSGRWDWWGVGQSVVGMLALAGGIKQLGKSGIADPLPWALLLIAAAALTVFVRRQLRLDHPLLQVRLFAKPAFSVAATAIFLPMVGMGAILFLVTQWFQYGEGYTPLEAGLRLLPAPLALIAASMVAPSLMHRFAIRHVLGAGLVVLAVGMALPWTFQQFTDLGYPAFAAALTVMGLGAGLATTVASVTLVSAAPAAEVSSAAAIEETCYELGSAMGVAVLGSTAAALYRGNLPTLELDGPSAAAVRGSVGEAAHTAERIGGAVGEARSTPPRTPTPWRSLRPSCWPPYSRSPRRPRPGRSFRGTCSPPRTTDGGPHRGRGGRRAQGGGAGRRPVPQACAVRVHGRLHPARAPQQITQQSAQVGEVARRPAALQQRQRLYVVLLGRLRLAALLGHQTEEPVCAARVHGAVAVPQLEQRREQPGCFLVPPELAQYVGQLDLHLRRVESGAAGRQHVPGEAQLPLCRSEFAVLRLDVAAHPVAVRQIGPQPQLPVDLLGLRQ